jgi:hypothetical protein
LVLDGRSVCASSDVAFSRSKSTLMRPVPSNAVSCTLQHVHGSCADRPWLQPMDVHTSLDVFGDLYKTHVDLPFLSHPSVTAGRREEAWTYSDYTTCEAEGTSPRRGEKAHHKARALQGHIRVGARISGAAAASRARVRLVHGSRPVFYRPVRRPQRWSRRQWF